MNKNKKYLHYFTTGLLTLIMCFSVGMYLFNYPTISKIFPSLGYPVYLIYPLAAAKVLGLVAIWSNKSAVLREWAYAGFFFNTLLALVAHLAISDGGHITALVALTCVIVSRLTLEQ